MKSFKLTLLIAILCFSSFESYAQVTKPFKVRYDSIIKGQVTTIGNNSISFDALEPYSGTETNSRINMKNVDIDNDGSTFNSSSATLANPNLKCFSIKKVLLYWSATDVEKGWQSGPPTDFENQPEWDFDNVKIMLPGQTNYTIVKGEVIYRGRDNHFSNDPYTCVKDITSLVKDLASPFGKYQIANIESATGLMKDHGQSGTGASGGWQIVFVYEYLNAPPRQITLFDGYSQLIASPSDTIRETIFNVKGFKTVPKGSVNASVLFGALEGDATFVGDQLQIKKKDSEEFVPIGNDVIRLKNNFFNSSITLGEKEFLDRNPASKNTLGFDAGIFELDNPDNSIIGNGQDEATLRMLTSADSYGLYLFGFSIEVFTPDLAPILLSSDKNTSTPLSPGEVITQNIEFKNNGNDDALNVVLATTLPENTEFVVPDNLPTGVTYTYDESSRSLKFLVDNSLTKAESSSIKIPYKIKVKDDCHFLTVDCSNLTLETQFTAFYSGKLSELDIFTTSSNSVDRCNLGNELPLSYTIKPTAPSWVSKKGDLNTKVSCDDAKGLEAAQKLVPSASCKFNLTKVSGKFIPDNQDCANTGKYINTWTFTDKCGLSAGIKPFEQIIEIYDNVAPDLKNCSGKLNDLTLQCGLDKDFDQQAKEWHDNNLKVLLGCASDNCSNITAENITSNFKFKAKGIPCKISESVTYSISDGCGNSFDKTLKIVYQDTVGPQIDLCTQSLDQTIECSGLDFDIEFDKWNNNNIAQLKKCAKDLCDPNSVPKIIPTKAKYQLDCGNTGTATVTYQAEDRCGNLSTNVFTATFTVKDTTKPFLASGNINNVQVNCSAIPPKPNVTFKDGCGDIDPDVDVVYKEETTYEDIEGEDFEITRTWTVTDKCNNVATFTQVIDVSTQTFIYNNQSAHCFDDGTIDLNQYLAAGSKNYGFWKFVTGSKKEIDFKDGIFDPFSVGVDSLGTFEFTHTEPAGFCYRNTRVLIDIHDNCIVYPCGPENFTFSKAITPNGDAYNQYFTVIGSRECEFKVNIKVFNRWGSIVYENPDYKNDWDGYSIKSSFGSNGTLPNGTYFYVVELVDSGFDLFTGPIYIGTK